MPKRISFFDTFESQALDRPWTKEENLQNAYEDQQAYQARQNAMVSGAIGSIFQLWARESTSEGRARVIKQGVLFLQQFEKTALRTPDL